MTAREKSKEPIEPIDLTEHIEHMENMELTEHQLNELRATATEIALGAGEILSTYHERAIATTSHKKNATDVVTDADKAAETFIVDQLQTRYPSHGIIGEEGTNFKPDSALRWIIDPLDGTLNYVRGISAYGPILSCEYQNIPVIGVCLDVPQHSLWSAAFHLGATRNNIPCRVSATSTLVESVVVIEGATDAAAQKWRTDIRRRLTGHIGVTR